MGKIKNALNNLKYLLALQKKKKRGKYAKKCKYIMNI